MTFPESIAKWLTSSIDKSARLCVRDGLSSVFLPEAGFWVLPMTAQIWDERHTSDRYLSGFVDDHSSERWVILWEDIWQQKRLVAESRLKAFAGKSRRIHGRKCSFGPVPVNEFRMFMEQHHLLGSTNAKYMFGLYQNGELFAAAAFGRPVPVYRNGREVESYELIRFCHRSGYHVSGGLSKLLSGFIAELSPEDIYTSVDREWSDGSGYRSLGFSELDITDPICFYIDRSGSRSRSNNGGIRICNAGNIRMALTLKK